MLKIICEYTMNHRDNNKEKKNNIDLQSYQRDSTKYQTIAIILFNEN